MKAREFAQRHLEREARERVADRMKGAPATAVSRAMRDARTQMADVDATIRTCAKRIALAEFIATRFADEQWPEDVKDSIAKRAVWLRELLQMARSECLFVE